MLVRNVIAQNALFFAIWISSTTTAFTSVPVRHQNKAGLKSFIDHSRRCVSSLPLQENKSSSSSSVRQMKTGNGLEHPISQQILDLAEKGKMEASFRLLLESTLQHHEEFMSNGLYLSILTTLSRSRHPEGPQLADELYKTLVNQGDHPTGKIVNSIIAVWAKSGHEDSAAKCIQYIQSQWTRYHQDVDNEMGGGEEQFVPMRSSYTSAITALSRGKNRSGRASAERAEALLEEMERRRQEFPRLSPNTITVNAVLNAWSKSRLLQGAARRSEEILERMISLGKERPELRPDTTSFNTVLDTLAKSLEYDREQRAEALLERMETLSENDPSMNCRPNEVSFNIVINCWAQSRQKGTARRATAILRHMTKRYESGMSDVSPNAATYTTTINAWARSREMDAVERGEEVLQLCEESFRLGNTHAQPNTLTYNSMINCYSKSKGGTSTKALAILESMKEKSQRGEESCLPDVVTYTSLIDTLAKEQTVAATTIAESLLQELEEAHSKSPHDERLKPNVRTYTSAINAIARSGTNPEKAFAILERLENPADEGNKAVAPDVVCYNALINAYGWSKVPGKALKCNAILQRMITQSTSGRNFLAKPDIITCNSVLNACAFDKANTEVEKAAIVKIVVDTLETFQQAIPRYGYPDHVTYSQVLYAISNQMSPGEDQYALAEATFWQCCQAGQVNAKVINALEQVLSWSRFSALMGPALLSREGDDKASFNVNLFPKTWTRHALKRKAGGNSKASRKRDRGYKVTNQGLKKLSEKSQ